MHGKMPRFAGSRDEKGERNIIRVCFVLQRNHNNNIGTFVWSNKERKKVFIASYSGNQIEGFMQKACVVCQRDLASNPFAGVR